MGRNGKLSQGMGGNGNQIIHNAFVRNGNGNSSWEWEGMGMKKAFPATSSAWNTSGGGRRVRKLH